MLYEVAILEKPTEDEESKGAKETLVVPPTCIIANDPQSAALLAIMEHGGTVNKDRMEVLVRPFA